jgi:hypothetical protein
VFVPLFTDQGKTAEAIEEGRLFPAPYETNTRAAPTRIFFALKAIFFTYLLPKAICIVALPHIYNNIFIYGGRLFELPAAI